MLADTRTLPAALEGLLPPLAANDPGVEAVAVAVDAACIDRLWVVGAAFPLLIAMVSSRSSMGFIDIVRTVRVRAREERDRTAARGVMSSNDGSLFRQGIFGDAVVYMSRIAYHVRRGYPIATWSELPLLLLQTLCWVVLRRRFGGEQKQVARLRAGCDLALLAAVALVFAIIPAKALPALCLWPVPLAVFAYSRQSLRLFQCGSAATLAATSVVLRWLGSLVRLMTTHVFLRSDPAVLANHGVGLAGCTLLLCAHYYYHGPGPSREATRRALYTQLISRSKPAFQPPQSPGVLMWFSLGGFGDECPSTLPESTLRKAFDAIDVDGDGSISRDELSGAITAGTSCNERTRNTVSLSGNLVSEMIALADADGDGAIDFLEYKAMIARHAPLSFWRIYA